LRLGRGVEVNPIKALAWYVISASNGHKFAAYNAALFYDQGRGVSVDRTKALKYYTIAAHLGSKSAQFKLGNMYFLGKGTDRNLEDAFVWLSVAQHNGHKLASRAAGFVMKKMTVKQVRSASIRIDKIVDGNITRVWF